MKNRKLMRDQLEPRLALLRPLLEIQTPPKGWIRAIRDALGMSARQLAKRTGMTQQSVSIVEKSELAGAVTLKTMHRIAEGLNCVFVCGFVPKSDLETTLRKRAEEIAVRRLEQVSHTMGLEDQALSEQVNKTVFMNMVDDLLQKPSRLWSK